MRVLYKIWLFCIRSINLYNFRKYYKSYKIIPFGCYCLPRVIAKHNKLKPSKKEGEESFPFDLCFSNFDSNVKLFGTKFDNFYNGFRYDIQDGTNGRKCWYNESINMICNHDTMSSFEQFKVRYDNRINNLYTVIEKTDKYLFFLVASMEPIKNSQVDLFVKEIAKYRDMKTFSIIIINQSKEQVYYISENVYCIDLSKDERFEKMGAGLWRVKIKRAKNLDAMLFNSQINRELLKIIKSKKHLWKK